MHRGKPLKQRSKYEGNSTEPPQGHGRTVHRWKRYAVRGSWAAVSADLHLSGLFWLPPQRDRHTHRLGYWRAAFRCWGADCSLFLPALHCPRSGDCAIFVLAASAMHYGIRCVSHVASSACFSSFAGHVAFRYRDDCGCGSAEAVASSSDCPRKCLRGYYDDCPTLLQAGLTSRK